MNERLKYFRGLSKSRETVALRFLLASLLNHAARESCGRMISSRVFAVRLDYLIEFSTLEAHPQLKPLAAEIQRSPSQLNTDFGTTLPLIFLDEEARRKGVFDWTATKIAPALLETLPVNLFWSNSGRTRHYTELSKKAGNDIIEAYAADPVGEDVTSLAEIVERRFGRLPGGKTTKTESVVPAILPQRA